MYLYKESTNFYIKMKGVAFVIHFFDDDVDVCIAKMATN